MSNESYRSDFIGFLDRLAAAKGHVGACDWDRHVITHYFDKEIEEMRRTIARLGISWAGRDWPEVNCELVSAWAKRLRQQPRGA